MTKEWIAERVKIDPKGTIESLLKQQTKQAKNIHEKNIYIGTLEKTIEKLEKEVKKMKEKDEKDESDKS